MTNDCELKLVAMTHNGEPIFAIIQENVIVSPVCVIMGYDKNNKKFSEYKLLEGVV